MPLRHLLRVLGDEPKDARNLTRDEARRAMDAMLSGAEPEVTVGAFLMALRWKGITAEELTGMALAARGRARIPCAEMAGLVTVCPPHDGQNHHPALDGLAALLAAAAGARVLLVSDRGVAPLRGLTAPVLLEGLGLAMTWDGGEAEEWVHKGGFACIAATGMLPELLHLRKVRKDLVLRTPLSTLEKLIAPPRSAVLLGAMGGPVLGTAVEVIQALGHSRGMAVQGVDGGIMPWVSRRTRGVGIEDGHLVSIVVEPGDFGLEDLKEPELPFYGPPDEDEGACDNPALVANLHEMTRAILAGEHGPARNATLLGAGLILKAGGQAMTLAEAVDLATSALDRGALLRRIDELRSLLQG